MGIKGKGNDLAGIADEGTGAAHQGGVAEVNTIKVTDCKCGGHAENKAAAETRRLGYLRVGCDGRRDRTWAGGPCNFPTGEARIDIYICEDVGLCLWRMTLNFA